MRATTERRLAIRDFISMKRHADPKIPDTPEKWLDDFNTFSIYQVLPKIIELWGLNVKVDVEAKKNFNQLTAK